MKTWIPCLALFCSLSLAAQQKGATPIPSAVDRPPSAVETRAVVVGISDYSEDLIPDLRYAHKDAIAFANWLRSPAGGGLPDGHIKLLTDKNATTANMIMAMDWLIDESRPGDRAFIHFSGHGDVERVTRFSNGYLLTYDSPSSVYGAGAFSLRYLQDILATLSENGVRVVMVTDACRSGKLAGSAVNGAQITATRLSQQFANEIKVLSCQPDEFSLEGEQWGGGRGCFSFHLENALYGFADANGDGTVSLLELGRYLEDRVSAEAEPNSQYPMVLGMKKSVMATVDTGALAQKQLELAGREMEFTDLGSKGPEGLMLEKLDTHIQKIYNGFLAAIEAGQLMDTSGRSANDYFEILLAEKSIGKLHGDMKRSFCAALLNEGQAVVNKILRADPQTLDNMWANKIEYGHLPGYFGRAGEILGEGHYAYNSIKAKEHYFKAKNFNRINYPDSTLAWRSGQARRELDKAVGFDSTAAYLFYEMGVVEPDWIEMGSDWRKKRELYLKAEELAPLWVLPTFELSGLYRYMPRKSIEYYRYCMEKDPSFLPPFNWIAWEYDYLGLKDSAIYWRALYVQKLENKWDLDSTKITAYECNSGGNTLWGLKRYKEAEKWLLRGIVKSSGNFPGLYGNLEVVYVDLLEFKKAIETAKERLRRKLWREEYDLAQLALISFYFLGDTDTAGLYYDKSGIYKESIGYKTLYEILSGQYEEAATNAGQYIKKYPNYQKRLQFYRAWATQLSNNRTLADEYYQQLVDSTQIEYDSNSFVRPYYLYKIISYHRLGQYDEFEKSIANAKSNLAGDAWMHFHLAVIYAMTDQKDLAIQNLYESTELGWEPNPLTWLQGTLCDPFLNNIRETPEYYEFVKKHFPYYLEVATRIPYKKRD